MPENRRRVRSESLATAPAGLAAAEPAWKGKAILFTRAGVRLQAPDGPDIAPKTAGAATDLTFRGPEGCSPGLAGEREKTDVRRRLPESGSAPDVGLAARKRNEPPDVAGGSTRFVSGLGLNGPCRNP